MIRNKLLSIVGIVVVVVVVGIGIGIISCDCYLKGGGI